MVCTQVTVGGGVPKKYDCINNVCVESAGGQYSDDTCAGACKKKDDTTMYLLAAVGVGLAYLLVRRTK